MEEGKRAKAVFSKLFLPVAFDQGELKSLLVVAGELTVLSASDAVNSNTSSPSVELLMNTLGLKEPVAPVAPILEPVVAQAPVVHQPTPPPVRLPLVTEPAVSTNVFVPVVAARELTSEDFGFLSSSVKKTNPQASAPASSSGLDLLFAAPAPVSAEQMRQNAVSELVGSLSDLSFMMSDTLVMPQPRSSVSLLDFL